MSSIMKEDWIECELGEVANYINGRAFKPTEWKKSGIPIIRIQNLNNPNAVYNYSDVEHEEKYLVKKGDLLFAWSASLGSYIWHGQDAWLNQHIFKVECKSIINTLFLHNYFEKIVHELYAKAHGSGMVHVTKGKFEETKVSLPPLPIQRAIVSKIEALFSDLDNGIANFKKAQEQLKVYRQAVLKKAFEGGFSSITNEEPITNYEFEITNEENHSSDNLPKGWKWVRISDVSDINPTLPNKANIDKNLEIQFLPMKLVEEIINKIHLTETRKFADVLKGSYTPFIDGDIIFAKVTPCMENGKIAIVNKLKNGIGFGSSEFHVLRCSNEILNTYLHYFIVQDKFRNEAESAMTGAVGLRRVPKKFIEDYVVPLPPTIAEQTQIVQEIESRLSVCDNLEFVIRNSIEKAEALRQSILKKAFEGELLSEAELSQCKAAADYEPAGELLKKIQAEKLAKEQEKKKKPSVEKKSKHSQA